MTKADFYRYQEQTFDAYVKRLIRNESIDARRELARRAEREVSLTTLPFDVGREDSYHLEELDVHMPDGAVTVFDHILGMAIRGLAPKWRDVIVMHYFWGLSDEKIGGILHLTAGAIRHRRKKALDRLKKTLEAMGYER